VVFHVKRTKELVRTGPPRRRSRLKARSRKRIELSYGEWVELQLRRNGRCELGPVIVARDPLHRCTRRAQGMHHLRKRSAAGRVRSRLNTRRACNPCNGWVEDNPALARAVGLVVLPGDPWWPWLGVRLPSGRTL
jgi:hypothetical protein